MGTDSVDAKPPSLGESFIRYDRPRYESSLERRNYLPEVLGNLRNTFNWPISDSAEIGYFFGEFLEHHNHNGIDIKAPIGTPITVPYGGKVDIIKDEARSKLWNVSLGDVYVYDEANGLLQVFAHLDMDEISANLEIGQFVQDGQIIGKVGAFQNESFSNPHLHYGISWSDIKDFVIPLFREREINPLLLLRDLRK